MTKRIIFAVALVLLVTGSCLAGGPGISAERRAEYGGTLVIGVANDADTFNPLFTESKLGQEIGHLLLLGLADLNDKSEFEPELARSWEHSPDYLTLTYHLRKDARWSDGVPITAEDVKFTYDVLMDSTVASPRQGVLEYVKQVRARDEYTVVFEFSEAYPDQLFDTAGEILPAHVLRGVAPKDLRTHPFGRRPISSGPFILKKWQSQQYIELVANEHYFGGRPYLDRVIFKIVPDESNLLVQLKTGEIDMMLGVPPARAKALAAANPNLALYPMAGRVYYYLGYNNAHPLFADADVRRALTMAIDRKGLVRALLHGFGRICYGPIPPMLQWAYNEDIAEIPHDPDRAREILAAAGWADRDGDGWLDRDGRTFEFTILTNTGNQLRTDLAVVIQNRFQQLGIRTKIQSLEWTSYLQKLRDPALQAYLGGWSTAFNVDPTPIFHSSAVELFNYVHYANPEVDRLIEAGRKEMDRRRAAAIWKQFQEKIYHDQPYTFLFWIDKIAAVSKKFKNVTPIALSPLYGLERWYLDSGARHAE